MKWHQAELGLMDFSLWSVFHGAILVDGSSRSRVRVIDGDIDMGGAILYDAIYGKKRQSKGYLHRLQ